MQLKLIALRDDKSGLYAGIHCQRTAADAVRELSHVVNNEKTTVSQYPGDFSLYEIAIIEDTTGVVTPITPPLFIVGASNVIKPPSPPPEVTQSNQIKISNNK